MKLKKIYVLCALPVIIAVYLIVGGCSSMRPALSEELTPPRFRDWWNFYKRGVAAANEGKWSEARHDFEICVGLRSGAKYPYPKEKWEARTYGVRFIKDYFPHRELGIALLKEGRVKESIIPLEESLRQEPTGRAKYFLNEAIKAVQTGKDISAPVIILDKQLAKAGFCREQSLTISGKVLAEGRVRHISVDERDEFIELAEQEKEFCQVIRLKPGTNSVLISAVDLNGRKTTTSINRIADWRSPVYSIQSLDKQSGLIKLKGFVCDDYFVSEISLKQARNALVEKHISDNIVEISLVYALDEKPILKVVDAAGNSLSVDIADVCSRCLAAVSNGNSGLFGLVQQGNLLGIAKPPAVIPVVAMSANDTVKPELILTPSDEIVQTYESVLRLKFEVKDRGGVASITLNGEEYLRSFDRGKMLALFSGPVQLEPGTNNFEVVAEDVAGNQSARRLTAVSSKPEYLEPAYRLTAGLPPFISQGNPWAGQARDFFNQELSRTPVRFRVMERDEGWDNSLRELGLSVDELSDSRAALKIGKLLPAELLFVGETLNQGNGVTVQVRAVDPTDGNIVYIADVYAENPDIELAYQLNGLFLKVAHRFPLLDGSILEIDGKNACINVGASQGMRVGSKFIVLVPGMDTDVLALNDRTVNLEIISLESGTSTVRVDPPEALKFLKKGDKIYAR